MSVQAVSWELWQEIADKNVLFPIYYRVKEGGFIAFTGNLGRVFSVYVVDKERFTTKYRARAIEASTDDDAIVRTEGF